MEADKSWLTVVITTPGECDDEPRRIGEMLRTGVADLVHIRKPGWSAARLAALLEAIPAELHPRLRLHDRFELLERFPLVGGVHLNGRNPQAPAGVRHVSRSCHSVAEVEACTPGEYDYVTLSPVFDSISKPGYLSAFDATALRGVPGRQRVVGLGGVTPDRFGYLRRCGFAGAAMLGYVWDGGREALCATLKHRELLRNFALQFITDAPTPELTIKQVEQVLEGGCRWVQIRMKGAEADEVERVLMVCKPLCEAVGATLLVDDNVELARRHGVGVHLGKNDMPAAEARALLGEQAIIGSTCNSAADIAAVTAAGASDYIGLGPFRFTRTKKNLAPVLGLDGYRRLVGEDTPGRLPVVAIGGITPADVGELLRAGADGVAVSGAIGHAPDPVAETNIFLKEINKYTI